MGIYLRELKEDDVESIFSITSDSVGGKFMRYGPQKDIEETKKLIKKYSTKPNLGFAIIDCDSDKLVGYMGLEGDENDSFCMSMMISPNYRSKGSGAYVISKMKELIDDKSYNVKSLQAYVVGDNIASRRILDKNGFEVIKRFEYDDVPQGLYVYLYPPKK